MSVFVKVWDMGRLSYRYIRVDTIVLVDDSGFEECDITWEVAGEKEAARINESASTFMRRLTAAMATEAPEWTGG